MRSRWGKLEQMVDEEKLDAYLLMDSFDIFYFSGIWMEGALLFTPHKKFVFVSPMYQEETQKGEKDWELIICKETLETELGDLSGKVNVKRCGFDSNHLSLAFYNKIEERFSAQLVPSNGITEKLRAIKDQAEINCIRKATTITIGALDYLKTLLCDGITEKEIAREGINYILKEADGISFYPIVLFGTRTSLPHGYPTNRALQENQLVLIDIGAKVGGYCADITRTFMWGEIPEKWKNIYSLVENLKRMAIQQIKPGGQSSAIDRIIREETAKAGYQEEFLHGTGHGVGLEVHEPPVLNRSSNTILEEGMVVTVEPGLYFAREGGVRIEDMVLITNEGDQILS